MPLNKSASSLGAGWVVVVFFWAKEEIQIAKAMKIKASRCIV
jgi:hypothetical protein